MLQVGSKTQLLDATRKGRKAGIMLYLLGLCFFKTQQDYQNGHRITIKALHKTLYNTLSTLHSPHFLTISAHRRAQKPTANHPTSHSKSSPPKALPLPAFPVHHFQFSCTALPLFSSPAHNFPSTPHRLRIRRPLHSSSELHPLTTCNSLCKHKLHSYEMRSSTQTCQNKSI